MSAVCTVHTVHQGQGAALSWDFWWRFPYCLGSCGHGAHSWCCGCPLRRGEIKAGAPCHKGACLVLFNSPKLWPGAKAAPCYGKHFITGTITTAQQDTEGETLNSGRKHSFALSFFFFHELAISRLQPSLACGGTVLIIRLHSHHFSLIHWAGLQ